MRKDFPNWIIPSVGILLLAALLLFEYGEAFNFYFVGDDFVFIQMLHQDKWRILWSSRAYYHYYPLGLLINAFPACFGIFEPRWYALVGFSFVLMSSVLVAKLYQNISGNLAKGFLPAAIFATAHLNSEVMYWKTGNTTIAMVFFSLLSLILFIRSLEKKSKTLFAGCVVAYAASMLCIEQGLITLMILSLYDLVFWTGPRLRTLVSKKRVLRVQFLRRVAILSAVPVLHTAVKLALQLELSPMPFASRNWRSMFRVMLESLEKLIDFNGIIGSMFHPHWITDLVLAIILCSYFAYILAKRSNAGLFFLAASLGSILAISAGTSGVVPRYFCLPLAFYACFLLLFIDGVAGIAVKACRERLAWVSDNPVASGKASELPVIGVYAGVCLTVAFIGLRGNLVERDYWKIASLMERNVVYSVDNLFKTEGIRPGANQKVYLLNVPEIIWSPRHSLYYVGNNSLEPDLKHRLGEAADDIELIASAPIFEVVIRGEPAFYRPLGHERMMEKEDIERLLQEGQMVLRFSPEKMVLERMRPNS